MSGQLQPRHIIGVKIEPRSATDAEKLASALAELSENDPNLGISRDRESGELIINGVSELHLDDTVAFLKGSLGIDVSVGAPQVAYRETLAHAVDVDYTHKKQSGGSTEFARVRLKLEPNEPGNGNFFEAKIVDALIPDDYVNGVEKGVQAVWEDGVLIGFPMVNMKVTLCDGAFRELESSERAFEIAARAAMKEGCDKGGIEILEPIMDVEVTTLRDDVGRIVGDINSRRGQIRAQEIHGNETVVRAQVPLALMFGFVTQLRVLSTRRASYTMQFAHYAPVPSNAGPDDFRPAIGLRA